MTKNIGLSFIVPFCNDVSLIADAIKSVFDQTVMCKFNFESLIDNDGLHGKLPKVSDDKTCRY